MLRYRPAALTIAFALIVIICGGCGGGVGGIHSDAVHYNPANDSFEFLHSWTNLSCATDSDLDHLVSIWKRRDSVVVIPFQFLWSISSMERLGNQEFRWIDLIRPSNESEISLSDVNLNTINVIPGQFYLNRLGRLCYFHQAIIPGNTTDALLKAVTPGIADYLATSATNQVQLSRDQRHRRPSWNDMRNDALRQLAEKAGVPTQTESESLDPELTPLDDTSLERLINAKMQNSINLSRIRDVFSLVVPLSPSDSQESIATFNLLRDTISRYLKEGKPVEIGFPEFVDAIRLTDLAEVGMQVSVNVTKLTKVAMTVNRSILEPAPEPKQELRYQSTIRSIQKRGIPVNPSFEIDELFAKYLAK